MIALAALLAIGVVVGAGADLTHPSPHNLSGRDVSAQIALGIEAEKGMASLPTVDCPSTEPIRDGRSFHCAVSGLPREGHGTVQVTEIDGRGHLRWQLNQP
jgi:hypothetical protein